ncbi:hypothetical protein BC834DRAFT_926302 [Gloeopeniophorella convolvens]|nr:hypothetical protein BC834DRAFT_926302 [Gloeopeniophorella convolvens]
MSIKRGVRYAQSPLFTPNGSAWDSVFEDIVNGDPQIPVTRDKRPRASLNSSSLEPRRQAMTNRELHAFDEMFNLIFSAANERKVLEDGTAAALDINAHSPLSGFLKSLYKNPRTREVTEDMTELDKLKEQLALCTSDQAMLEWAEREVFGASVRAEEATRAAFDSGDTPPQHLQPPSYPHLLAALMRTARERYDDPHLALAFFEHARNLSTLSYVFGCTTEAYNELLETRWDSFRDLRGVHTALEEMRANGIPPNSRTRAIADDVRREAGARTLWLEESESGSGEVWTVLAAIERLAARRPHHQAQNTRNPQVKPLRDLWKDPSVTGDGGSGYHFGFGDSGSEQSRWKTGRHVAHSS